ncbi:Dynein heavy chain 2, axonemal [Hondaea fermentalgiana]|uniref:Dynein heavy chain, cytoplasmic n=1 Tax=Hondaea fermentalgiana TaxID=2315210 RepID=A0A2R5GB26_9STRA|nr:Dynein heavy chain 2, axonemal [Hondaea fermentalgiana]|eukprot:GBG28212.1 Dynein heavy chain 2, axonemal [Hondaea fermentalgiana]
MDKSFRSRGSPKRRELKGLAADKKGGDTQRENKLLRNAFADADDMRKNEDIVARARSQDPRISWVAGLVSDFFRSHTLDKFAEDEDTLRKLKGLLDSDGVQTLYVVEQGASLRVSSEVPSSAERRGERMLYFTKLGDGPVSREKYTSEILVGDCNVDPVQQLELVTQDVFMPLLSNTANQASWSDAMRKEMMDNVHSFVSSVQITSGLMRGETFLPLPNLSLLPEEDEAGIAAGGGDPTSPSSPSRRGEENIGRTREASEDERREEKERLTKQRALGLFAGRNASHLTASAPAIATVTSPQAEGYALSIQKERIHVFEGCLITWTKQIRNVLRLDPESKLQKGKNPGPLEELAFWKRKAANLNSVFEQLQTPRVRKVLRYLDSSKSTYNEPFAKLCKEAFAARDEANSNVRFLRPLRPWLDRLTSISEFLDLPKVFRPTMHTILLIWKTSEHYNTVPRLVVLMRQLANAVIARCVGYLSGSSLFSMIENDEHTKANETLKSVLRVIGAFKSTYFDYKARANAECITNPWKVQNAALFTRLDTFLERCHDLLDLTQTIWHFSKLNKIEIGGTKGKTLTTSVHQVHADFENGVQAMKEVSYDVMDVDAKAFDDDFYEFRVKIKELERRIASVLAQGFEDCPTITGRFKLLDSFEQFLERPVIQDELEHKHIVLLETFGKDLEAVQQEFQELRDDPPIGANMPPTAGALAWCRGLLDRVSVPMAKLRELNTSILDRESTRDTIKAYTSLIANLAEYEHEHVRAWEASIESSSISKLKLPLLRRNEETQQLIVNFDPALVHLLREVKYFRLLGLDVPSNALEIYEKVEDFRRETGNLELIVQKYNKMHASLLPVEKPLLRQHLHRIDKVISQGLRTLTWKSHGIESFINEATGTVQEADDILTTMKDNMEYIEELLERWQDSPILHRTTKAVSVEEFNLNAKREVMTKYQLITDGGREIHKLLKEVVKKLKVSAGLPDWKTYVDFINNIVIAGLSQTACVSLAYLQRELDLEVIQNEAKLPLIEVDLILSSRMVLFSPSLDATSKRDGIRDEVENWIDSFFAIGSLFKRLDSPSGTYNKEITSDPAVMRLVAAVHCSLDDTINLAEALQKDYGEYQYLWTTDLNEMFATFLSTAFHIARRRATSNGSRVADVRGAEQNVSSDRDGTESQDNYEKMEDDDEIEEDEDEDDDFTPRGPRKVADIPGVGPDEGDRPILEKFDERINVFQTLRVEIAELAPSKNLGFLRVNTQPIKQALSTWVTKWIYLFTQYLHDYVTNKLRELHTFVQTVESGLEFDLNSAEFDDDALMAVMRHIASVRKRMTEMGRLFSPLAETLGLLRKHGISFEAEEIGGQPILDFLEHAPEMWDSTVNNAFKARERIQPKQTLMATRIKKESAEFNQRLQSFRREFLEKAPFGSVGNLALTLTAAYDTIDQYTASAKKFSAELDDLRALEELFEVNVSRAAELDEIFSDLALLKRVWDTSKVVDEVFSSWKPIPWDAIDTDGLESEVRRLANLVNSSLPEQVHEWGVFVNLHSRVSNMATTIPLIHELHSPALRDRHWKQVMAITGSQVEKNAQFCFVNALDLQLHRFADQVTEIVEVATKELKVDQRLKAIEDTWAKHDLHFEAYKAADPDFKIIASAEVTIEALEEHQLQLQTLAGLGKFMEYFRERVTTWQRTLGVIESTLTLWLRVQRTWASLEAIFLSGSDIRSELPEDTKRFEELDESFRALMTSAVATPNAKEACCHPGRFTALDAMWRALETCQRALNEYLDQKKNIFPRFFFVSNLALLDILSNGNEPRKIIPHLSACFHGIDSLDFVAPRAADEEKRRPKSRASSGRGRQVWETATAMTAPDGERVDFPSSLELTGPVERWLQDLASTMHQTLRSETSQALSKTAGWVAELPRHKWALEFPAQVVQLAAQVMWTDECRTAIEELEAGQEDALEKYHSVCTKRLQNLIELVQNPLSKEDRVKIIALLTLDVHGKEVVENLIQRKVESPDAFSWRSQLRYFWSDEDDSCAISITDFHTQYSFEYVGNVDRLVITPLTDRCYITLTMALRLNLGGAPAGPAGTGKTETTKDLAKCLGLPCYVFNCSDQMNYQTIGDIFKGLSQTGAWGCFDEFNRIPIEVLSVVATQVKTILDAIRYLADPANRDAQYASDVPSGKPPTVVGSFDFMGCSLKLVPTTGFFITMNPGYAGRTELPENLKAHFRSCAMIRPDLQPICQNMLMAEGFVSAAPLSVKFVTLYKLSAELLSQQPHYDWGLRNVKSVLRVAGILRRGELDVDETAILMRALRDFNVPKLPAFDLPIFLKLVGDLFPGITIPPKFDETLKERAKNACNRRAHLAIAAARVSAGSSTLGGESVDEGGSESLLEGGLDAPTDATAEDEDDTLAPAVGAARQSVLQPEEDFLNKVVNLQEILEVRHSVMLLGPPGCGKTSIWQTLADAHNNGETKPTCVTEVLNPKALTSNELYGYMTLQRDWRDGALSIVMRNMSQQDAPYHPYQRHHWIVLDGDIDAIWIESMNTVMDDNKVLTLVSNERIQLTHKMRMLFEVNSLQNATPATVSRAGILFINEDDVGWGPLVESWLQVCSQSAKVLAQLQVLFRVYMQPTLALFDDTPTLQHIVPRGKVDLVQTTCRLLQCLLDEVHEPEMLTKSELEHLFVFAVIWGTGSSVVDRKKFSTAWLKLFSDRGLVWQAPVAAAPEDAIGSAASGEEDHSRRGISTATEQPQTNVFDYFYCTKSRALVPWLTMLDKHTPIAEVDFQDIVIPTIDSVRCTYVLRQLSRQHHPVCLIGSAGTGKTTVMREFLRTMSGEFASATINVNYYTDAAVLQTQLEHHVDKRSGKIYGPPGEKKLVFFVDDLNMARVEEYGTQTPLALLRQFLDYGQWFDRGDLGVKKEIRDVQIVAAMNHKAGSFTINPRLQRHLAAVACSMPEYADLQRIYGTILSSHLDHFVLPIQSQAQRCVDALLELHELMCAKFLPSATRFHYNFNMRNLSSVVQGLCRSSHEAYTTPLSFVRLFLHESMRVFSDRLVSEKDMTNFRSLLVGVSKKYFEEEQDDMFEEPLLFADFVRPSSQALLAASAVTGSAGAVSSPLNPSRVTEGGRKSVSQIDSTTITKRSGPYVGASSMKDVQACLEDHLMAYNKSKAKMDLVLFQLAAEHVCRIARIIGTPGGNALLVGVGGSGKQSLSRLAAFICNYEVVQIPVTSDFGLADFQESLKALYRRAGLRTHAPVVLLLTDAQIVDERFLVYINDVLSSGSVPDLFSADELDGIFASLRAEAKMAGIQTTSRSSMADYFVARVKRTLHIILSHSPVGETLRVRARRFPGLVNCTSIDWFHPWPREALVAVAGRFLKGAGFASEDIAENVMHHIAEVHLSVTEVSQRYLEVQKRYNYVTPKTFLEMLSFYRGLLSKKRAALHQDLDRLSAGLDTLRGTARDVAGLQEDLKETMARVEERKDATEELLTQMAQQRGEAEAQQKIASKERIRAETFATEAKEIEEDAETELAAAQPAMAQAEEAVNCLTKASLTELKSLTKPPAGVDKVTTCVLMMIKNEKRNFSWDNAKRMMNNTDKFKQSLEEYDAKNIPEDLIERIAPIVSDADFTFEKLAKKSSAAANMANWVINICAYNKIYKKVKPLMDRLEAARASKEDAMADLARVETQLRDAEQRLEELQHNFKLATNEKSKVEVEAAQVTDRLALAERLVKGLASENSRWERQIEALKNRSETLVGDSLLAAAFVSYIGAFDSVTRSSLWRDIWTNDILSREIPLTEGVTPLSVLAADSDLAQWGMEGLPVDAFSLENGAIIASATSRWPLVVDPQMQAASWLRTHFGTKEENSSSADVHAVAAANSLDSKKSSRGGLRRDSFKGHTMGGRRMSTKGKQMSKLMQSRRNLFVEESEVPQLMEVHATSPTLVQTLLRAIEHGRTVILEGVDEELDATLAPLLARSFTLKGRQPFLQLGGHEVEFNSQFRLVMTTRLSNPHFRPEVLAQCTLINFIVTEGGLEDQLLARVVSFEKSGLEKEKQELQLAFNRYKIQLVELEKTLLEKLSNAPPDILSDVPLIESLEATKATASEVALAVERGHETEKGINEAREVYRAVAVEASMLYFMLLQLASVDHMYQYSLDIFIRFFDKALRDATHADGAERQKDSARDGDSTNTDAEADGLEATRSSMSASTAGSGDDEPENAEKSRVRGLVRSVRATIFKMVSRGLFETHKTVFLVQLTFNLLRRGMVKPRFKEDRFDAEGLDFLLRAPQRFEQANEIEWLPETLWQRVCALAEQAGFEKLPADMIESEPRFREWYNSVCPETEKLPLEWRELEKRPFMKILVLRALRPDRVMVALSNFVRRTLPHGDHFVDCDAQVNSFQILEQAYADSRPDTPVYFVLSPGANVAADVERLARRFGLLEGSTYVNISLGQGQDVVAMKALEHANKRGGWVFLNNVHLMPRWLHELVKKLESFARMGQHEDFRLFLSSDPCPDIPVALLNRSIRLTNEPPAGLKANLTRAWAQFAPEDVDNLDSKSRSILFGLCYFHSVLLERKTYLTKGFNLQYPISTQDLTACAMVLRNYMDNHTSTKVPWEDLRYLFGEIMYGGHIIDDFDRRVCKVYLSYYMRDELFDDMQMFPYVDRNTMSSSSALLSDEDATGGGGAMDGGDRALGGAMTSFIVPSLQTHERYADHVLATLTPKETPLAYGLHPNAEIGFRTDANARILDLLHSLQPSELEEEGDGQSAQHVAEAMLQDMLETYRDLHLDTASVLAALEDEEMTPFQNMYLQECARMEALMKTMVETLTELELGFTGDLTMTEPMERLMYALYQDRVPDLWRRISYPSERPLGAWLADLQLRVTQLQEFCMDPFAEPRCTWISGFFNPNAFLTAVLQASARQAQTELDKLVIVTEVTKRQPEEVDQPSHNGRFITGLFLEGATWDTANGTLMPSRPKETIQAMPVINVRAVPLTEEATRSAKMYHTPVYRTQARAGTYIFTASLLSKLHPPEKWVLLQTVLLMDPHQ